MLTSPSPDNGLIDRLSMLPAFIGSCATEASDRDCSCWHCYCCCMVRSTSCNIPSPSPFPHPLSSLPLVGLHMRLQLASHLVRSGCYDRWCAKRQANQTDRTDFSQSWIWYAIVCLMTAIADRRARLAAIHSGIQQTEQFFLQKTALFRATLMHKTWPKLELLWRLCRWLAWGRVLGVGDMSYIRPAW